MLPTDRVPGNGAGEPAGHRHVFGEVDDALGLDLSTQIVGQFADAEQLAQKHGHDRTIAPAIPRAASESGS